MTTSFWRFLTFAVMVPILMEIAALAGRNMYGRSTLAKDDERRATLVSTWRMQLQVMRFALWVLPLTGGAAALAMYLYELEANILWFVAAMTELTLYCALAYSYLKWLIRYVTEHEIPNPQLGGTQ